MTTGCEIFRIKWKLGNRGELVTAHLRQTRKNLQGYWPLEDLKLSSRTEIGHELTGMEMERSLPENKLQRDAF